MVLPDDNYGYFSNNPSQIQIQNTIFSCFRPYDILPKKRTVNLCSFNNRPPAARAKSELPAVWSARQPADQLHNPPRTGPDALLRKDPIFVCPADIFIIPAASRHNDVISRSRTLPGHRSLLPAPIHAVLRHNWRAPPVRQKR